MATVNLYYNYSIINTFDMVAVDGVFSATVTAPSEESYITIGEHLIGFSLAVTGSSDTVSISQSFVAPNGSITVSNTVNSDVNLTLSADYEKIYQLEYTGDVIYKNTNIAQYYPSMGDVYLYAPVLTGNYRFNGWYCNDKLFVKIDSELLGLAENYKITLSCKATADSIMNLYGNIIPEEQTSDIYSNKRYVLMSSGIDSSADRQLSALDIAKFYDINHSVISLASNNYSYESKSYFTEVYVPLTGSDCEIVGNFGVTNNLDNFKVIYHFLASDVFVDTEVKITHIFGTTSNSSTFTLTEGDIFATHSSSGVPTFTLFPKTNENIIELVSRAISSYVSRRDFTYNITLDISEDTFDSSIGRYIHKFNLSEEIRKQDSDSTFNYISEIVDLSLTFGGYNNSTDKVEEDFFNWMNMSIVKKERDSNNDIIVTIAYDKIGDITYSDMSAYAKEVEGKGESDVIDLTDFTSEENYAMTFMQDVIEVTEIPVCIHIRN